MQVCVVLFSFLKNVSSHFYEASLIINFELIYFIALQDIWELEQTLEQSQKENREMEKDLDRERRNKDDLEKQIKLLNMEKGTVWFRYTLFSICAFPNLQGFRSAWISICTYFDLQSRSFSILHRF